MTHECIWTEKSPVGCVGISSGDAGIRSVELRAQSARGVPCAMCQPVSEAFQRYFGGDGMALERLTVDLALASGEFQRRVYETLRGMAPAGATTTYGELAAAAGRPGAARAVGRAMAQNPVPIVVPCHRVLRAGGGLGGYGGGLSMKRFLLGIEGVQA